MHVRSRFTGRSVISRSWLAVVLLAVIVCAAVTAAPALADGSPPSARSVSPGLTIAAAPDTIVAGGTATLVVHFDLPAAVLALSRMRAGETDFTVVRTIVTGADGSVELDVSPKRTAAYRVEFAGDATWDAAAAETTVSVKPRLRLTATSPVYEGWKVVFTAEVAPAHPGATVDVQRLVDGTWTWWRTVTLNDRSRAIFRWVSDERGSVAFRLAMVADADHIDGAGAKRVVLVKDPNPYNVPARFTRIIVVDKSQYRLYFHERGRVIRVFDCVLGKPSTPTPLGHFNIYAKDTNVGGPYGPRRMRYLRDYAIHGTDEPWLLTRFPRGYSHGCTRLANANILWLFDRCRVGTPVWNVP